MATHSSVLAWRIPGTEEPSGLPSLGSHRVGHDWSDIAAARQVYIPSDLEVNTCNDIPFLDQHVITPVFPAKVKRELEILKVVSSFQFSHSVISDFLRSHGPQHTRLPCPSPTPRAFSNSCPSTRWCHPIIPSSVIQFCSHLQPFPASGSFPRSQFFASRGQRIAVSASALMLPMNILDWFPLGWTGWISLQSKGFSRVFSNTTVQKHRFFGVQLSLWSNSHIHTWLLKKP